LGASAPERRPGQAAIIERKANMNQPNPPQGQNVQYLAPLPTSTLAIVSLVAGILGFTMLPVLASIVALVSGYMARGETRSVPPKASGDGLATAGIVMGYIQLGLIVVGFCCIMAYFLFVLGLGGVLWAGSGGR
jgi:hypothetical protein